MSRYLVMCVVSACVGGFVALAFVPAGPGTPAVGQERTRDGFRARGSSSLATPTRDRIARREEERDSAANLSDFSPEERVNISVYENVNRSVVHITTRVARQDPFFFSEQSAEGAGSGSVLDREGHILTNYHVVEGAQIARVTLFNNKTYRARPIGVDADNDIAVLKIDAPDDVLYPVKLGSSSRLRVGQKIFAIGNPFGLERTMTVGIISSLNRQIPSRNSRQMKSIIQLDAALNRGNSGGPLLNSRGELIGMNTAIASPSGAGENTGVGFAIPVSTVKRVVPQLIKHGRVIRPDIGITRVYQTDQGLVIARVTPGGPADQAGLRGFKRVRKKRNFGGFSIEETGWDTSTADKITAVEGKPIRTADDLLTILEAKNAGDAIEVTVLRDGRRTKVRVVLDNDGVATDGR